MSSTTDAGEPLPSGPERLGDALRAGVIGVQARGRSDDIEDAITPIDGLRALLGHREP